MFSFCFFPSPLNRWVTVAMDLCRLHIHQSCMAGQYSCVLDFRVKMAYVLIPVSGTTEY